MRCNRRIVIKMGLLHFHKYEQKSSRIPLSFNETKVEIFTDYYHKLVILNLSNGAKLSGVQSGTTVSKKKKKKKICSPTPFLTQNVQRRLRNVQKRVMHVQSCCFANVNLLLFLSRCRRRRCLNSFLL